MRKKITYEDLNRLPNEEYQKIAKRMLRKDILAAWDIYSKNVAYGVELETYDEHYAITVWYQALKDLENWAFEQIPANIKKYM